MVRSVTRTQVLIDLLIAVLIVVPLTLFDGLFVFASTGSGLLPLWPPALGLLLIGLLTIRRLAPIPSLYAALLLAAVHVILLAQGVYAVWFAVIVLLATVGRYAKKPIEWWLTAITIFVAALLVSLAVVRMFFGLSDVGIEFRWEQVITAAVFGFVPSGLFFGGAVLAGVVLRLIVRTNREARDRQQAQASMLSQMQLRAAEEERTAIARDMHDVVAHSLAVVVAQANGARYAQDVAKKDETLATIAGTAKSALTDVRGLLHQLRHSQAADANTGLDDIPGLVEQIRATGVDVRLMMPQAGLSVARTSQLAAYRIVQEALTNSMRHGFEGTPVFVRLVGEAGHLSIDVHNRPRSFGGTGHESSGHGVTGMRERASLAGGSSWIGFDSGWFRVNARLPLEVQL